MTTTQPRIRSNLLSDALVKSANAVVRQAANIAHAITFKIIALAELNWQAVASGSPGTTWGKPGDRAVAALHRRGRKASWLGLQHRLDCIPPAKAVLGRKLPFCSTAEKPFPSEHCKRHFATLASALDSATLKCAQSLAISMTQPEFDPFGEPVSVRKRPVGSGWLTSFAAGLFWMLVTTIVVARAFYFDPRIFSFEPLAAWKHALLAVL